ncbi:hypothetical protein CDAR_462181 [Caerostris darwini]|uniref:Uncharacterized protein n=1 Tax=Caerostris darwini TaxID=1538125 RepID=A0AAV4RCP4_9ARAC|nr:hypothetical protein CDAR_462181 [Caerostris darwini]
MHPVKDEHNGEEADIDTDSLQIKDSESEKIARNRKRNCEHFFNAIIGTSSVQAVSHFGQSETRLRKFFWLLVFVLCLCGCGIPSEQFFNRVLTISCAD